MLRKYANLLFALFGADCPLFLCLVQIISAFKGFSRGAREKMSHASRASILWVLLKQSRHFAIGEMEVLHEFRGMHESLSCKQLGFTHAETPEQLWKDDNGTNKRKSEKPLNDEKKRNKEKQATPPPINNPNCWHPKVKEALLPGIRAANNPGFKNIMMYCNQDITALYPFFGRKCIGNTFLGTCYNGRQCERDHSLPDDAQVEKILEVTKKFRDNPTGILQSTQG
jgi:hypothetical protein